MVQDRGRDDGLDEIVPGAQAQGLDGLVQAALAGYDQDRHAFDDVGQVREEVKAVHDRHLQVDDEQVGPAAPEKVETL